MFSFITCPLALGFDNTALKKHYLFAPTASYASFYSDARPCWGKFPCWEPWVKVVPCTVPSQPSPSPSALNIQWHFSEQEAQGASPLLTTCGLHLCQVPSSSSALQLAPASRKRHVSQLTPGDSLPVRGARTGHSLQVTVSKTTSRVFFHYYQVWKGKSIFAYFTTRKRRAVLWLASSLRCIFRNRET